MKNTLLKVIIFSIFLSVFLFFCCDEKKPLSSNENHIQIQQPEQTDDGWQTASLNDVDIYEGDGGKK